MPMASPVVFAVSTTVGFVLVLVVQFAICTAAPCIVMPVVRPVVLEHPTVVLPFTVSLPLFSVQAEN
jgi:hypothetical protein